jgi:hypothetical protein
MASVKRWQWIVASLIVGFLAGWLQTRLGADDPTAGIPDSLTPAQFESEIYSPVYDVNGARSFRFTGTTVEVFREIRDPAVMSVKSITRVGNSASVTVPNHYAVGTKVRLSGAKEPEYNGEFIITDVGPTRRPTRDDTWQYFLINVSPKAPATATGNIKVEGEPPLIYVVKGFKFPVNPNKPEIDPKTGESKLLYEPVANYMLLPYGPYRPSYSLPQLAGTNEAKPVKFRPSLLQRLFELQINLFGLQVGPIKQKDPDNSILDFLATMQANTVAKGTKGETIPGNGFQYKWWSQPRVGIAFWTLGTFVAFGLFMPTLINIMTFGSIFRPKEEKSASLWRVKSSKPQKAQVKVGATAEDWEQLQKMEKELEEKLGDFGHEGPPMPTITIGPQKVASGPPARLSSAPVEIQVEEQPEEKKDFGADADDFYPTEVHQKHKKPGE